MPGTDGQRFGHRCRPTDRREEAKTHKDSWVLLQDIWLHLKGFEYLMISPKTGARTLLIYGKHDGVSELARCNGSISDDHSKNVHLFPPWYSYFPCKPAELAERDTVFGLGSDVAPGSLGGRSFAPAYPESLSAFILIQIAPP